MNKCEGCGRKLSHYSKRKTKLCQKCQLATRDKSKMLKGKPQEKEPQRILKELAKQRGVKDV